MMSILGCGLRAQSAEPRRRPPVDAKAGVLDEARVTCPATVLVSVEVVAARDVTRVHFLALGPVARAIADDVGVYVAHGDFYCRLLVDIK